MGSNDKRPLFRVAKTIDHLTYGKRSQSEESRGLILSSSVPQIVPSITKTRGESYSNLTHLIVKSSYDYEKTTACNHSDSNKMHGDLQPFHGKYADIRELRDYSYHPMYFPQRQLLQDVLIANVVDKRLPQKSEPWIIYTAGPMGAGKTHTVKWMSHKGYFPLENIYIVDPDEFKKALPEWNGYVKRNPLTAGDMTHLESSLLVEISQEILLKRSCNMMIDGSLRDWEWHQHVFTSIKKRYPQYKIAILYVYADLDIVYKRIAKRAKETGRLVPQESVDAAYRQVPESIQKLTPYSDAIIHIDNSFTPNITYFADKRHPNGYKSPRWQQIKNLFPEYSQNLKETAERVVNRLLDTKEPLLFSRTYCTWCDRAKQLLQTLGVKYQVCELNIYEPSEITLLMQSVLKSISGTHAVPQLYFNKTFIGNFDRLKELYISGEVLKLIPTDCEEGPLPELDF